MDPIQPQFNPPPAPIVPPTRSTRWGLLAGILLGAIVVGVTSYFLINTVHPIPVPSYVLQSPPKVKYPLPPPPTDGWKTFTSKFGYILKYPPNFQTYSDNMGALPENAHDVHVCVEESQCNQDTSIQIQVRHPGEWVKYPDVAAVLKLNLADYAYRIWALNKNDPNPYKPKDKQVGELRQTTISGQPAYQFTLNGSYADISGGGDLLNQEFLYTLLSNNGYKYLLRFPSSNKDLGQILSTFRFTK